MMKWLKRLFLVAIILTFIGIAAVFVIYYQLKSDLPDVTSIQEIPLQVPMKVLSKDGELISQFGEKRRIPLSRKEIPDQLVNAFIATEDSRFYQHVGMDPIGILRAASVYIMSGSAKQGASTITQQVARNFFLTNEKTILRKVREIFIAIQIEQILTKDEILMLYLNKISLGHRSFGVGAAAQVYFGKNVSDLTLSEMAVLAGLPKAPSRLNPIYSVENATERRNIVLSRMLDEDYISQKEYEDARNEKVLSRYHGAEITLSAHYVAEIARNKLIELYGEERSYNEGFNVYTTITTEAQQAANNAVIENSHNYDMRHGYRGPTKVLWEDSEDPWSAEKIAKTLAKEASFEKLQPAVVVAVKDKSIEVLIKGESEKKSTIEWDGLSWARSFISDSRQGLPPKKASDIVKVGEQIWVRQVDVTKDKKVTKQLQLSQYPDVSSAFISLNPQDGAITSLVGGYSFAQSKFNRATQAKRQVGSNIKPFIYSAALDNGYTLATLVNDTPINQWSGSEAWRPKNSPAVYDGPIRLRQALGQSKNVVSVRLVEDIGLPTVIDQLTKFGFNEKDMPRSNSLALGSASMTPIDLATGYAIVANGGYKVEPYIIERIEDAYGTILYQAAPQIACPECTKEYKIQETAIESDPLATRTVIDHGAEVCAISPITKSQIAKSAIRPDTAFLVRELLRTAVWGGGKRKNKTNWNGTGWRAARAIGRQDMGGKTGTTNNSKDAWFSGFVGNMVATSWVGFDNFNRELGRAAYNNNLGRNQVAGGEFGSRTALPAWNLFMSKVMKDKPEYKPKRPASITTVRIDAATGLLTTATDSSTLFEFFRYSHIPKNYVPEPMYSESDTQTGDTIYDDELF